MAFQRVAILGVGLMGGSVGMACVRRLKGCTVIGYNRRPRDVKEAIRQGAVHFGETNVAAAVDGADLVILCTPVGTFGSILRRIAPVLREGAIVTDVGSTKRSIAQLAEQHFQSGIRFVGSHPMAGSEKHGVRNASADLLVGRRCIITPITPRDGVLRIDSAVNKVIRFWRALGMRTRTMDPELHDQMTADMSHLPHAVAAALVRIQSADSLRISARGFSDTTRLAAGDTALWRDIFVDNSDHLCQSIVRLRSELEKLLVHLQKKDEASVRTWLKEARDRRLHMADRSMPMKIWK